MREGGFVAPQVSPNPNLEISARMQRQILEDWVRNPSDEETRFNGANARVSTYLGTFGNAVVVVIDDAWSVGWSNWHVEINGFELEYGGNIFAWQNRRFTPLRNMPTRFLNENIEEIYEATLKNLLERSIFLQDLPVETEREILLAMGVDPDAPPNQIINIYLGTYCGLTAFHTETLFGIPTNRGIIYVWDGENLFHLNRAYYNKLISDEIAEEIYYRWNIARN